MTPVLRRTFLVLSVTWAGTIFYLSSQPGIDTPLLFPGQDKLIHLVVFGILGFLMMGTMKLSGGRYHHSQVWFAALMVALYGVSDEIHQYFVPGRSAEVLDAMADGIGGTLGAWGMFLLVTCIIRPSPAQHPSTDVQGSE